MLRRRILLAPATPRAGTLSGPVPIHKTDPSYPPEQIKQHIEGEVVLFGIIREDGSVDSVQIVRSLDPVLDKKCDGGFCGMERFTPAHRNAEILWRLRRWCTFRSTRFGAIIKLVE